MTDPDSPFSSRERIAAADIADDHARLKRACYALLDDLARAAVDAGPDAVAELAARLGVSTQAVRVAVWSRDTYPERRRGQYTPAAGHGRVMGVRHPDEVRRRITITLSRYPHIRSTSS